MYSRQVASRSGELSVNQLPVCLSNNLKRRPHKRFLRSQITPESTIPGAFKSEVSTASRLCDGALALVDVVEGVWTQVGVPLS